MTPLKALILQTLKQHGPLSDLGIFGRIGDEHTGGLSAMIVIACVELHEAGFIEPPPNDPNVWQLSNKGLEFVSALRAENPMPPVEIAPASPGAPPVMHRYLVLEIRGGDEQTAKSWYGMAELEFEHMVELLKALLPELPPRARRNPPALILHKPAAVQL